MVNRQGFLLIHAACSNVIMLIVMNSCANIRSIVSESGLTRRTSRLEKKKLMKPQESPELKKQIVAIRAIRGLCEIGVLLNSGSTNHECGRCKFCNIYQIFRIKGLIFLEAGHPHEISCLICYFLKT